MKCCNSKIWFVIGCVSAIVCIGPQAGFSGQPDNDIKISPISLSANVPGIDISRKLMERLVVRTELNRSELEALGIQVGKLSEEVVQTLLDTETDPPSNRYIRFFDMWFTDVQPHAEPRRWKILSGLEDFILDAISLGDFDAKQESLLRGSLKKASEDEDDNPESAEARTTAYQLLLETREKAVRKARGHRRLIDELELELGGRELEKNVGLVVEIRTQVKRPTISPVSRVKMRCEDDIGTVTILDLVFHERKRWCDDFGICRIESIGSLDPGQEHGQEFEALFKSLKKNGRIHLDGCTLTTNMLIDGTEVVRDLPGSFTSHLPVPFP